MDEAKYSGERYWFVGCLVKLANSRNYWLSVAQNFFEENPTTEIPYYCSEG